MWTEPPAKRRRVSWTAAKSYHLERQHCSKVLNGNTLVTGMRVTQDWLPRMQEGGCKFFAWLYYSDVYSRLSTDKILVMISGASSRVFESKETALPG